MRPSQPKFPSTEPWVGVFTKRPVPGRVKTRLSPALSQAHAARLALGFLDDSVARLRQAPGEHVISFAPNSDREWFAERYPDCALQPQVGEGLGARMAEFFERGLETRPACVMTGSDQPLVPSSALEEAVDALARDADLVLGPDRGGGYYLVGLRRPARELFLEVPMSTATMFQRTMDVARRSGLRVHQLEVGLDVDTEAELEQLEAVLREPRFHPKLQHTRRALEEIGRLEKSRP